MSEPIATVEVVPFETFCANSGMKVPLVGAYKYPFHLVERPTRTARERTHVCDLIHSMNPSMSCAQTR